MGIPQHANLGDSAIALAEEKLINAYFPKYKKYYMQEEYLDICCQKTKKYIDDEDIILLHGGGNIGDIYDRPERGRRKVIETYQNNKIIIFPQTAYFSNTDKGKEELEVSKKIYNAHKNLVIMAREQKSYEFMKEHFYNAKVYLTPDIVMTLNKSVNKPRKGALFIFRNDREKTINEQEFEIIKETVSKFFSDFKLSDMSASITRIRNVAGEYRDILLTNKFNEFQTAELVITDRLHGMIFSAITETPCIVLESLTHKTVECFEWLKE